MAKKSSASYWMYGKHACEAALQNSERRIMRACITRNAMAEIVLPRHLSIEETDPKRLEKLVGAEAVHQGIALEVLPLEQPELEDVLESGKPLIMLDQVTDPHNVGAILRSAAAFDAAAVIVHDRNAPREGGVMAKSASGALDVVPLVSVTNLVQAMDEAKQAHYWCVGLDAHTENEMHKMAFTANTLLIMGAEGKGMRRLTTERCDSLVKLPMSERMESLNVSNAAAIALYTLYVQLST